MFVAFLLSPTPRSCVHHCAVACTTNHNDNKACLLPAGLQKKQPTTFVVDFGSIWSIWPKSQR